MVVLWALVAWFVVSVPASLVIGRLCRGRCEDVLPAWTSADDREVRVLLNEAVRPGP